MNREIKFRAWFSLDKKMVEHENLSMQYDRDEGFTFAFDYMSYFDEENMKGTLNFELMQYTGLKDKNGKEIYEGDLLKDGKGVGEVKWVQEHCAFLIRTLNPHMYHYLESDERLTESEVTGNIYENPELLEVSP